MSRPSRTAALLLALATSLVLAPGALAQPGPATPPLKATILLGPGAPPDGVFLAGVPIPIVLQIENVSPGDIATTEGFSSTDFFRRLYFTDPNGGTITNTVEDKIHGDSRVFMCLSRQGALQASAIPVAPIEILAGPATPPHFFREYLIPDARQFYNLTAPGRYSVNARVGLLVFELSDPAAAISNCDQVPGTVANVASVTGRNQFTIVSNTLEFEVQAPPPAPPVTTATVSPLPNASGWISPGPATVSFIATSPSGVPIQRIVVQTSGAENGQQTLSGSKGSITISTLGQTNVAYHAEDTAGLIEQTQLLTVKIASDATPPELTARCAPPGGSPLVAGRDSGSGVASVTLTSASGGKETYRILDQAGNVLDATFGVRAAGKQTEITLVTLAYGGGTPGSAPSNRLKCEWSVSRSDVVNQFEQKLDLKSSGVEVQAKFDAKKNQTEIRVKRRGIEQRLTRPGLVFILLTTQQGTLGFEY